MQRSESRVSISSLEQDFAKMGKVNLLDALMDMKIDNPKEVYEKSIEKSKKALSLQKINLSVEDGAAIAAYFYKIPPPQKFDLYNEVFYGDPSSSSSVDSNPNEEVPSSSSSSQPSQDPNPQGIDIEGRFGSGERGEITNGGIDNDMRGSLAPSTQQSATVSTQSTATSSSSAPVLESDSANGLNEDCDPEARKGEITVYRVVTDALADPTPKKKEKLERIKRFLYLFLKALRSLPRYHARNFTLYRTMMIYCPPNSPGETKETLPNVWWDFPYVSSDMSDCDDPFFNYHKYREPLPGKNILRRFKCIISSKENGPWGYDVSRFTDEKTNMRLLMEPEVQYTLSVSLHTINYEVNIAPVKLERPLKPLHGKKNLELEPRDDRVYKSNAESVTGFKAKDTFYNGVTLTWNTSKTQDPGTIYEVVRVDGFLVSQVLVTVYRGSGNEVSTSGLKAGKKYSFRVRRGTDEYWGPWSKDLSIKTENYPKITNIKCENISTKRVKITWDSVKICPDTEPNYKIQIRTLGVDGKLTKFESPNISHTPEMTFNLKDLKSSDSKGVEEFQFRVQAEDGDFSEIVSGREYKSEVPKNPRIINKTCNSITFAWDLHPNESVYHCVIKGKETCYMGRDTQYTLENLYPGNNYNIKLACAITVNGKKLICDGNMSIDTQTLPYSFPGHWQYTHAYGTCTEENTRILMKKTQPGVGSLGVSSYPITPNICRDPANNDFNIYWKVRINKLGENSVGAIGIGIITVDGKGPYGNGVFFNCANWCIYFGNHKGNVLKIQGQGPKFVPGDEVMVQFNPAQHFIIFRAKGIEMGYDLGNYDANRFIYSPAIIMYGSGDSVELLPA